MYHKNSNSGAYYKHCDKTSLGYESSKCFIYFIILLLNKLMLKSAFIITIVGSVQGREYIVGLASILLQRYTLCHLHQ